MSAVDRPIGFDEGAYVARETRRRRRRQRDRPPPALLALHPLGGRRHVPRSPADGDARSGPRCSAGWRRSSADSPCAGSSTPGSGSRSSSPPRHVRPLVDDMQHDAGGARLARPELLDTCATPTNRDKTASTTADRSSISARQRSAPWACSSRDRLVVSDVFPPGPPEVAFLLHDFSFILFAVSLVFHVYLATVAEPGHVQLDDARDGLEGLGAAPPPAGTASSWGSRSNLVRN